MNWSGLFILAGVIALAVATFPFGLVAIPIAVWLWRRC